MNRLRRGNRRNHQHQTGKRQRHGCRRHQRVSTARAGAAARTRAAAARCADD
jgi:hypothetical protein